MRRIAIPLVALLIVLAGWSVRAADEASSTAKEPVTFVKGADLDDFPASTRIAEHIALRFLKQDGDHKVLVVRRDASGEAELHQNETDLWVVRAGSGTLVTGGTIIEPRDTAPGEVRGASIEGGETRPIGPGDVVDIPPRIPHQILLEAGTTFTYVIVKVREK